METQVCQQGGNFPRWISPRTGSQIGNFNQQERPWETSEQAGSAAQNALFRPFDIDLDEIDTVHGIPPKEEIESSDGHRNGPRGTADRWRAQTIAPGLGGLHHIKAHFTFLGCQGRFLYAYIPEKIRQEISLQAA